MVVTLLSSPLLDYYIEDLPTTRHTGNNTFVHMSGHGPHTMLCRVWGHVWALPSSLSPEPFMDGDRLAGKGMEESSHSISSPVTSIVMEDFVVGVLEG